MDTEISSGVIPAISVTADCLPEAWEKAVIAVWDNGLEIKTQYDKASDPPSKDATVMVTINNPLSEPRIHKNFPGGPAELDTDYGKDGREAIPAGANGVEDSLPF